MAITAEADFVQDAKILDWTPTAALSAGQVIHLPDGRAAVAINDIAASVQGAVQVSGIYTVDKTASMVMLKGTRVFWDTSASKASVVWGAGELDYFLGVVEETAAAADTTVKVALNQEPCYTVSLAQGFETAPVGAAGQTQVLGHGNGVSLVMDTATEAQKLDALSIRSVPVTADAILSAMICVNTNGDDAAFDLNIGLANDTHATDADSITESLFCHIDGNSLNILAESDDGTTEVAATDTTKDFVVGTPFLFQADMTDNADVQIYIDGVNVLAGSTFDLSAATGPLKLLVHAEKTSNDSPGNVTVLDMGITTFDV